MMDKKNPAEMPMPMMPSMDGQDMPMPMPMPMDGMQAMDPADMEQVNGGKMMPKPMMPPGMKTEP